MKKADYTKETLLDVLSSYLRMIERDEMQHPTAVLGDIKKSIESVLRANEYDKYLMANGYDKKIRTGEHMIPAGATWEEMAKILCNRN